MKLKIAVFILCIFILCISNLCALCKADVIPLRGMISQETIAMGDNQAFQIVPLYQASDMIIVIVIQGKIRFDLGRLPGTADGFRLATMESIFLTKEQARQFYGRVSGHNTRIQIVQFTKDRTRARIKK